MKKFSLMELVVVMAIIAILTSLLIPTLSSARKKGKAAFCASNLHQLGVSTFAFAMDNDRKVPSNGAIGSLPYTNSSWWTGSLKEGGYLNWTEEAMTCPSLPFEGDWTNENYVSFGATREKDRNWRDPRKGEITSPYFGFKITDVESPSEFFWYADSAKLSNGVLIQWNTYEYQYKNRGRSSALRIHTRHSEKANLWLVDGHVSSHHLTSLKGLGVDYIFSESGAAINF
jgi:prepilin-type processing-associated H-X9-DG protein